MNARSDNTWRRWALRHLEAAAELGRARMELQMRSWRDVIDEAEAVPVQPLGHGDRMELIAARTELALRRASRLIPGARCIHRAVAGRRMLARRGIDARVVIGLRSHQGLDGHAWLEFDDGSTMFADDDAGFRRVR